MPNISLEKDAAEDLGATLVAAEKETDEEPRQRNSITT